MAIKDNKKLRDGFMNMIGGVDSNLNPNLLQPNQLSFGVNVTMRGGYLDTRPGFIQRSLLYDDSELQAWVETRNIQGASAYSSGGKEYILFMSGGRLFRMQPNRDYTVSEITPTNATTTVSGFTSPPIGDPVSGPVQVANGDPIPVGYPVQIGSGKYTVDSKNGDYLTLTNVNSTPGQSVSVGTVVYYLDPNAPNIDEAYFLQAEKYMIIQDGRARAMIYDGALTRRATYDPAEVPTGKMMAFSQGRIWVAVTDTEFVAGDISGGETGILQFTENALINQGGKFKVPEGAGRIKSMVVVNSLDTQLGQGPLQVLTERSIFSINAPPEREAWLNLRNPIQTVSLINYGSMSTNSTVVVNGDLFFRARDGVRSFIMARREFGTWGNRSVSREMQRVLQDNDEGSLGHVSAVLFDNRILMTNLPRIEDGRWSTYHKGIIALNFDPISSMKIQGDPIWEGVWTGINPYMLLTGVFNGEERCFAFCRSTADTKIEFWEISKTGNFDGDAGRIVSVAESAAFVFKNAMEMKRLHQFELWVDRVVGTVDFQLLYRPDQYPCWFQWPNDKQICSKYKDCSQELSDCLLSRTFKDGYRTRLRWGWPTEQVESFDGKPANYCYEAQVRLQWTGKARIKAGLIKAYQVDEEPHSGDLT